jgi:uncharacterized protein YecT (DUF1311 family)
MRVVLLALVAALVGWTHPAGADTLDADLSLRDTLPLFEQNHCAQVRDPVDQLFCGDPTLQAAGARLDGAAQERLGRIADRQFAVEENVEWLRHRNLSCGIFPGEGLTGQDIQFVKACLLKETEERIAILSDPNFDCLATNTTAGLLICGDPALTIADKELSEHVLGLVAGMKEGDAKAAFAEYARWTRDRDRKCHLADKDNVPLAELSSSESCLAEYLSRKTAEIVAARGDAGKVFHRPPTSPTPDADAVDLCVAQIHATNDCGDFLRVSRIIQIDTEVSAEAALVTAEVEMKVLTPFRVCSPVASSCTGTCWDPETGQAKPSPGSRQSLTVAQRLRIEKSFAFRKTGNGDWLCTTGALHPIELGIALGGP